MESTRTERERSKAWVAWRRGGIAFLGMVMAGWAALQCGGPTANGPSVTVKATCGNPGEKLTLRIDDPGSNCGSVTVVFPGGGRVSALRELVTNEVVVTIPANATSGAITVEGCGGTPVASNPVQIPCGPDSGTPDGAVPDGAVPDGGTTCTTNGTCDPNEDCACTDCTSAARCGAGCTMVDVTAFPWNTLGSAVDGKINLDGGNLQHFPMSGQGVGVTNLVQPTMQSQCGGSAPCFQVVTGNFSTFYIQTSGVFGVTQASPPKGYLKDVAFRRRVNGDGGAIGIDPDAGCFFIKAADLPK